MTNKPDDYKAYTLPFKGKLPEIIIVSDVGICVKCFSMRTVQDGCSNPECPKIVYREKECSKTK